MSPSRRIFMAVAISVGSTMLPMSIMTRLPGMGIPFAYWLFAFFCPLIMSFLISRKLVMQGEGLRLLHEELKEAHEQLRGVAETDHLTRLLNRGAFLERLERPGKSGGWLLVLDVDHFKAINDRHGHAAGDRALSAVAAIMRQAIRSVDAIGRMGGEEFAIYLPRADEALAHKVAERVRELVEQTPIDIASECPIHVTVSIGLAPRVPGQAAAECLRLADNAMYRAKYGGRNRIAA